MCVLVAVDKNRSLQQAALEEYGADLHMALRSRRDELLYLRKLTEMLFPYVMPPKATDCRCRTHRNNAHTHFAHFEKKKKKKVCSFHTLYINS